MVRWLSYVLLFTLCGFEFGKCGYIADFNDAIHSCKNFDNKKVKVDMGLAFPEDSDGGVALSGDINLEEDLDEGVMIDVEILKQTDTAAGAESMAHMVTDLCESMKDEDAPWSMLFELMGVSSCPIAMGTYHIDDLMIDLDFLRNMDEANLDGNYDIVLKLVDRQQNEISCNLLDVQVSKLE